MVGRGVRFALDKRDCEGSPLLITVRACIVTNYMRVTHLLCRWPRGSGFWRFLVIQNYNRMMNDLNVRVRINKVDDHWVFSRPSPHA